MTCQTSSSLWHNIIINAISPKNANFGNYKYIIHAVIIEKMETHPFKRSALIISTIVTILFIISRWNPFNSCSGITTFCYNYAKMLAVVWVFLSIFRNLKLKMWVRIILALVPVFCLVHIFVDDPLLTPYVRIYYAWAYLFVITAFIPLVGVKPTCGKSFNSNLIIFIITIICLVAIHALTNKQAILDGYGVDCTRSLALLYNLIKAASIWALIALCFREEVNRITEIKYLKVLFLVICVAGMLYVCFRHGLHRHLMVDNLDFGWNAIHMFMPVIWYMTYCIFRGVKKITHAITKK